MLILVWSTGVPKRFAAIEYDDEKELDGKGFDSIALILMFILMLM